MVDQEQTPARIDQKGDLLFGQSVRDPCQGIYVTFHVLLFKKLRPARRQGAVRIGQR